MDNKKIGKAGEDAAARFLARKGYKILHRNWRCLLGEIDIVAKEKDFIVFVEIKTRSSPLFGAGFLSVNYIKQSKLITLAKVYLKRYGLSDRPCRIDIVSIDAKTITLIRDAFWNERGI